MHFNNTDATIPRILPKYTNNSSRSDLDKRMITLGILSVDEHSRVTLTRKVKSILGVKPGDAIVVLQNMDDDYFVLKVQRGNNVLDYWLMAKYV